MLRVTLLYSIVSLAAAAAVLAQQPQPTPEPMPEKTFSGEVASVDAAARTVVVKERESDVPEKSMTFLLDEETKIKSRMTGSEKALKLEDLEAGDRVVVRYTVSAGKNNAEEIEILKGATSSY